MSSKVETYETQQQPQSPSRVKIKIREHDNPAEHAPFLKLEEPPFKTGRRHDPGSHNINLKNDTPHDVRFCFKALDNTPIANLFESQLNTEPGSPVGWVQLEPHESNRMIVLSDAAFDTATRSPLERRIGTSATKLSLSGPCVFDDDDTPDPEDIVIDAGT